MVEEVRVQWKTMTSRGKATRLHREDGLARPGTGKPTFGVGTRRIKSRGRLTRHGGSAGVRKGDSETITGFSAVVAERGRKAPSISIPAGRF